MACAYDGSAQLVKLKEIIKYETWNSLIRLRGEDQVMASLWRSMVVVVKGKLEARHMTNRQDGEVRVEGLAPMDLGNGEEQARQRSMQQ